MTTPGPGFTSNLDDREEWLLSNFVHHIELMLYVIMLEDKVATQVVFSSLTEIF